ACVRNALLLFPELFLQVFQHIVRDGTRLPFRTAILLWLTSIPVVLSRLACITWPLGRRLWLCGQLGTLLFLLRPKTLPHCRQALLGIQRKVSLHHPRIVTRLRSTNRFDRTPFMFTKVEYFLALLVEYHAACKI